MPGSSPARRDPQLPVTATLTPVADRRWAGDRAHRGDVEGAWGSVRAADTGPRRSWRNRRATLLAVMGPGVIVMVADNDASGVSLYAQAGHDHGLRLLWLLLLLAPVLFVSQEMVARLGAVTGAGHARLIFERFGRRWGRFAVADLLVLNTLTIVTGFIGVALAGEHLGVSRYVSVPVAAAVLVAVTVTGSFRGWERAMYLAVGVSLLVVPLALVAVGHFTPARVAAGAAPHVTRTPGVVLVIALVGTTVAPWQLFLQQSNVVDKRLTSRWVPYERVDTLVGAVLFVLGACAVLVTSAVVLAPTHRPFGDAADVAHALTAGVGAWAGALFALVLLNGSLLGAAAVTLSTSYAIGDATGLRQSLHRPWRQASAFHGSYVALLALAAAVVLLPGTPMGLVTVMANVLAGVLLPSATVFLLLLCNDREVLGPWVNPRWLNALAGLIVAALVALSALLVLTTLFPREQVPTGALVVIVAVGVVCAASILALSRRDATGRPRRGDWTRLNWTMPPLESLPPPVPSRGRAVALAALRGYLLVAALLVLGKTVQLAVS